ncbi:peptidoglycan/LPS O-acetylase OafA/YrhL [Rhodoferax ferrireducens]|uniref:Peptidoglycan/LPS O-acetylase OafA/YrhL n=1 Tax=Rhodoferax ferrireducens TaxID=192843 RepID=A0ABU2C6C4_9BURK|nr:acyltransferase [Rhodoferax ferrireducens]MDR7376888.1 peptidoglycan/LPS O-acetylase OafA/YrhL [Rhodoferax ferrireducens]
MHMIRDQRIDFLRFIGLSMIILAHVGTPSYLFQLRNFDVPLMVLVSGMSFSLSFKTESNNKENYSAYFWKRFKRLVLPVWIFLTFLFLTMYCTGYPTKLPDIQTIESSYLLIYGIGYVWIIRVFLLVALIAPFLMKANLKFKRQWVFYAFLALTYIAYEIIYRIATPYLSTIEGQFFENTFLYLIPFGVIFAFGLKIQSLPKKTIIKLSVIFLLIFSTLATFNYFSQGKAIQTQQFKYPPTLYYLSYAIGISLVLWLTSGYFLNWIEKLGASDIMSFIAKNSIWIYLWHIPFIEIIQLPFYIKYIFVYGIALLLAFIQIFIVTKLVAPKIQKIQLRKNFIQVLTG